MSPGPTPAAGRSGPGTAQRGVNPTAHATTSPVPTPLVSPTDPKTLATRFGAVTVDSAHLIGFENGLFGFARHQRFLLAEVPGRDVAFKLLQAVDDPELGFLVLPLDPENGPIARAHLEAAASALGFAFEALAALAVVTLRRAPDELRCTANLRAPLLIDTALRVGWQYVLADDAYDIRHAIHQWNGSGAAGSAPRIDRDGRR